MSFACTRTYTHTHIRTYIHIHTYIHILPYTHTFPHTYVCLYIYIFLHTTLIQYSKGVFKLILYLMHLCKILISTLLSIYLLIIMCSVVKCTLYSVHCTLYNVQCIVYNIQLVHWTDLYNRR